MLNLLAFYRGDEKDSQGRSFEEMLGWSDEEWEACHDYIQLLFPTRRASNYNEDAPLLTDDDIEVWKADPILKENLRRAFYRWLGFLGLEQGDDYIAFKKDLTDFQTDLWEGFNHNYLRITRVLDCLMTVGLTTEASEFYEFLKTRLNKGVTENTFRYWTEAVEGNIR